MTVGVSGDPAQTHREMILSGSDFERIRVLIRDRAGIDLGATKQNMVYSRLTKRLRERGHASFASYLDSLGADSDPEWQEFVNCLTTNLTGFFREAHHFPLLEQLLRAAPAGAKQRIWSCAASTGEEAYSIAMTVVETGISHQAVSIDASDIDTRVLAFAESGEYAIGETSGLSDARLRRFFQRGIGANLGKARVRPELRDLLTFRKFNLARDAMAPATYDFIFCRNVLIYFDKQTQRNVLQTLHRSLKPGGRLFVGHSEHFAEQRDLFQIAEKTTYIRVDC